MTYSWSGTTGAVSMITRSDVDVGCIRIVQVAKHPIHYISPLFI